MNLLHNTTNIEVILQAHRDGDNVDVKVNQSSAHPPVKTIVIQHKELNKNAFHGSLFSNQPHFKGRQENYSPIHNSDLNMLIVHDLHDLSYIGYDQGGLSPKSML